MEFETNNDESIAYNRLAEVLKQKGITGIVLAIVMDVNEATVSRWLNNKQQPSISQFYKIARVLKANFQELFIETKWDAGPSEAKLIQIERKSGHKTNNAKNFKGNKTDK